MVRIRMRRVGARHQPSYRIVAADKESPRDGKFLEVLGFYNPRTEPSTVKVDEARLFHWLERGAQPSEAVVKSLRSLGTWERWDRYKAGEALETLLSEAKAATPEVDPRTRRDDLFRQRADRKARKKAKAEEAPAPEPAAEVPEAEAAGEEAAQPEEPEAPAADEAAEAPSAEAGEEPEAPAEDEAAEEEVAEEA